MASTTGTLVEQPSDGDFTTTIDRLVRVLGEAGLTVFARIDHAAAARAAGLAMPPTVVLLYGNAKGGTPIMLARPEAALDLPLRVLVREGSDGKTSIAFHPIGPLLQQAGVAAELAARLEPAQQILSKALRA